MKKGVDNCGKVCYHMQVACERAARFEEIETKKFWEKRKKVLTTGWRSDIIQKLSTEKTSEAPLERKLEEKLQKILKKGLDKSIRT